MKKFTRILCVIFAILTAVPLMTSCSKEIESTPVNVNDFRITAYVVGDTCKDLESFESGHIETVTDVIFFGKADFNEQGEITLADDFELCLGNIKKVMADYPDKKLYLNILGPSSQSESDDWYEQMDDQGERHNNAFKSGKLEGNIKSVLEKYGFDGIFFDYEFPIKKKYWKEYNRFIVSLDRVLGNDFEIGMSMVDWDLNKQSQEAMAATDRIEVMSYDNWDDDGNHATFELAKDNIEKFVKAGYDKAKLDLGVPFYARPTTGEAYWYEYKAYYDKFDENGLYKDDSQSKLTFSFNTYDVIKQKTDWAISEGLGGMMVWHWACDTESTNEKSLFAAMKESKTNAIEKSSAK